LKILIDQRIELLTIIQTLCGYWDNLSEKFYGNTGQLFRCKYKDEITEYFEKNKYREILRFYNNICNEEQDISAFLEMILCHSQPPELNLIADYNRKYDTKNFIDLMRKFYFDSDFSCFFNKNKDEYEKILNDFGDKDEITGNTEHIFNYLGEDNKNYELIISPLVMGNFGIKTKMHNKETINYIINSPFDYKENKYVFNDIESLKYNLWHEIGHTVINDLTQKYISQIDTENIKIPDIFRRNFYVNAETIVNEYIIRAITIRLSELFDDKDLMLIFLDNEIKRGFKEINAIKDYIIKNCEDKNKIIKDDNYRGLVNFVISKI
jgi:hypothetical protein